MSGTLTIYLEKEFEVFYYDEPADPSVGIFHPGLDVELVSFRGIDITDKITSKEMDELADMVKEDLQQAAEDARDSEADGRYEEWKERRL